MAAKLSVGSLIRSLCQPLSSAAQALQLKFDLCSGFLSAKEMNETCFCPQSCCAPGFLGAEKHCTQRQRWGRASAASVVGQLRVRSKAQAALSGVLAGSGPHTPEGGGTF